MATDEGKVPEGGQETPKEPAEPKGAKAKQKPPKKGGGVPGWAVAVIIIVVIAVIAGIAVGVVMAMSGGGEEAENQAPVIASLTADPDSIAPGEGSTITCVVDDADDDTLTYTWMSNGGTISGTGDEITWIAPHLAKGYVVEVTVSDGNGGTDEASVAIVVGTVSTPTPVPTATVAPTPTSTPAPSDGSIDIQSNPSGARVFIDGSDTGNITPYIITHVSEGSHVVRLVYPHYDWRTEPVMVYGGETAYINWALDYALTETATIQPDAADGKDSSVFEGDPTLNRGTETEMYADGMALGFMHRAYVQFDLSSVPSTAVVIDAKLGLFYEREAVGSVAESIAVYRVKGSWDELTITWDDQPSIEATAVDEVTLTALAPDAFINWDIDDLAQAWISGSAPNRGVSIRDADETGVEGYKVFYTSDYGTLTETPKLTIQYYDPAP